MFETVELDLWTCNLHLKSGLWYVGIETLAVGFGFGIFDFGFEMLDVPCWVSAFGISVLELDLYMWNVGLGC